MCLAEPAISTLFGNAYATAPLFLALLTITYVFTAFGSLSIGNFISSQGKTRYILYLTLISVAVGLPIGYVLIMKVGVLGLIITSILTNIPTTILSLYWVKKYYKLTVDWLSSAKIVLSSAIAAASTFLVIMELSFSAPIRLILGIVCFAFVFIVVVLVTRTINRVDLENFRGMVSALGAIGKVLNSVLFFFEKIMKFFNL
jgi:O-antigen/teichoic acid export membrane protein